MKITENKIVLAMLLIVAALGLIIIFSFDGNGNSGDSVKHYLMAKNAFEKPHLFLDHWGKPLFTLLAAPFAQFGFKGVKIMNLLLFLLTGWFTYKTAFALCIKHAALSCLFFFCSVFVFVKVFTGFTEYLSAFMLILSIYLTLRNHTISAAVIVSFLPFVRSEGLIIVGVFAIYFALHQSWKEIGFLLIGHLVYSVIGYFYHWDILWVFTKIPYAETTSRYGNGDFMHFVRRFQFLLGVPLYILFWFGLVNFFFQRVKTWKFWISPMSLLIYGLFLCFFMAHTLFWALGVFHSMGLVRVFITVAPIVVIIVLTGFNRILHFLKNKWAYRAMMVVLVAYVLIFPFTSNPAAISFPKDFKKSINAQIATEKVAPFCKSLNTSRYFFADPYLAEALDINYWNHDKCKRISRVYEGLNSGDVVIWDDWFSGLEYNINLEELLALDLKMVEQFEDAEGRVLYIVLICE